MNPMFRKEPSEQFTITVDFSNNFGVGEAISTKDVKAYDSDGEPVTADIIDSSAISGDDQVDIVVKGGTDQENYEIVTKVVTNASAEWELDITMEVSD